MTLAVGDLAPDFTLPDTDGNDVTLSSLRGAGPVAIVFIPFAFTGVCEGELCELRDRRPDLDAAGCTVLAVTCDRSPSNKVWRDQQGFDFPLLSDGWPHGAVAQTYGCFNEAIGCAERLTVIIDADGRITSLIRSGGLGEARDFADYERALAG